MPAILSTMTAIKDCLLRERTLGRRPASPARRDPSRIDRFRSAAKQGSESPCGEGPPPGRRNRQRGVALFAVMIAIAIVLVFTGEFGTSTTVDLMAAANYRDQMRAHFLARSALNLSELVIRIQQRLDNTQIGGTRLSDMGIRITDFADQVLLAFCGNPEEVQSMVGFSSSDVKGLGVDIGTCGIVNRTITTDDDKINLNCANGGKDAEDLLKSLLDGLVYFPTYDPVFEEADAEGYRRDRATQVAALLDYVDVDSVHIHDIGTIEDYGYESLRDKYRPKNTYLDTIGEIRQVRGVDDRFWTLFGPAFTVYGGCKVNLSAASNPQLIAAILYLAANPKDPILQDPLKVYALAGLVAQARQFGEQFNKLSDFVDFVKDPQAAIGMLAGKSGTLAGSAATAALASGIPALAGQKLGMELNMTNLGRIAATGPRRTYRVEAFGEIERKQKSADGSPVFPSIRSTVTGVWDTKVFPQQSRKTPSPKGAWVFLRED